jgi:hypothetical protein
MAGDGLEAVEAVLLGLARARQCVARVEEDAADAQARQRTEDRGEAWAMLSL